MKNIESLDLTLKVNILRPWRGKPIFFHGIEPTRDWTQVLKIGCLVAGGRFHSYYNLHCIKLDKERKLRIKEKISFMHTNNILTQYLKMGSILCWVQFHAYRFFKANKYFQFKHARHKLKQEIIHLSDLVKLEE